MFPPDSAPPDISQYQPIGSGMVRRLDLVSSSSSYRTAPCINSSRRPHPLLQLIPEKHYNLLQQQQPSTIILRMAQRPNIKLLAHDITTLLTSGEQTHHELLLFGLENATKIYSGTYLEPAFFPILQ
jgi:hypothetical protein